MSPASSPVFTYFRISFFLSFFFWPSSWPVEVPSRPSIRAPWWPLLKPLKWQCWICNPRSHQGTPGCPSFLGLKIFRFLYHTSFICSSVGRHLSCLRVLATVLEILHTHLPSPNSHWTDWEWCDEHWLLFFTLLHLSLTGKPQDREDHVTQAWPQWLVVGWEHDQTGPIRITLVLFFFFFLARIIGEEPPQPL